MISDILSGLLADGQYSRGTGVQGFSVMTTEPVTHQETYKQKAPPK